jgi:hypothetical protein
MTTYETSDLHKRISRYETALEELQAAHQDVRNVLHDQLLYDRWQQIGMELGFVPGDQIGERSDRSSAPQMPQLSESWAG